MHQISSVPIIWNTFSMRSLNYSLEILLSPFSSISSKMSSTYSLVGLSTPISLAIWISTCQNYPLSRQPLPSMSTFLKACSIRFFIFLASFISSSINCLYKKILQPGYLSISNTSPKIISIRRLSFHHQLSDRTLIHPLYP